MIRTRCRNAPLRGITTSHQAATFVASAAGDRVGRGRAANGNFALSAFSVPAAAVHVKQPPAPLKLRIRKKADVQQKGLPVAATSTWTGPRAGRSNPPFWPGSRGHVGVASPVGPGGGWRGR